MSRFEIVSTFWPAGTPYRQVADHFDKITGGKKVVSINSMEASIPKDGTNGEKIENRIWGYNWIVVLEND